MGVFAPAVRSSGRMERFGQVLRALTATCRSLVTGRASPSATVTAPRRLFAGRASRHRVVALTDSDGSRPGHHGHVTGSASSTERTGR